MRYFWLLALCVSSLAQSKQLLFSDSQSRQLQNFESTIYVQPEQFWQSGLPKKQFSVEINNQQLVLIRDKYFKARSGKWLWLGHIQNKPFSHVGLAVNGEQLTATLSYDHQLYQLIQDKTGRYTLHDNSKHQTRDIDPADHGVSPAGNSALKQLLTPVADIATRASESEQGFTDQQLIRLLIYFPQNALNNTPNLADLIELDVARANQVFENNQLAVRLEIAKMLPLEIGDTNDVLSQMRGRSGPFTYLDRVRQQYRADLVHFYDPDLITISGTRSYCGYANYAAFPDGSVSLHSGVGVTSIQCAGGLTFTHEIGHNLGARHDRFEQNGGDQSYANYGYVNLEAGVRTVMSYNDACSEQGINCERIDYFSTPALTPDNYQIGIAQRQVDSADNSSMLSLSANTLANFSGPEQPQGLNVSNGLSVDSITINWNEYAGADSYLLSRLTVPKVRDDVVRCIPGFVSIMKTFEVTDTTYVDTDVEPDKQYCYWLQAKNSRLLQGGQTSPKTFIDTGYVSTGKGVQIGKIDDLQVTVEDVTDIIVPVDTNVDLATLTAIVEEKSFTGELTTYFERTGEQVYLRLVNEQQQAGNARVMVSTGDYVEAFTLSYQNTQKRLPQFSQLEDHSVAQDAEFELNFSLSYWDSSSLTPIRVYSDNYNIVSPEQITLSNLGNGEFQLLIRRESINAGSAKITLATGNSESDVSSSFVLTYEREHYRAPVIRDVQFTLDEERRLSRKLPAFDPDDDRLEFVITQQPQHGTLELSKGNDFEYIANNSFEEGDFFTFYAVDPFNGQSAEATVTINAPTNNPIAPLQQIVASSGNVMLLTHEGDVWSWGENEINTAGRGRDGIADWQPVKTQLTAIADIGTAELTYYIKQDGTLWYMGQYYDGEHWHYFDKLQQAGEAQDWKTIECQPEKCWLIKQDGSFWQMEWSRAREDETNGLQHSFAQLNGLYGWQQLSINSAGGLLSNDRNEVWSFSHFDREPPGRARDMAELAQLDVPILPARVQLNSNGGLLMYQDMTYAWGDGLSYFNGQTQVHHLPALIDNASWQSATSDNTGFAAIINGSLYSWAYHDIGISALYAHLARGENPDFYRDTVGDYDNWLDVYMPASEIMFAIRADGSLWSAGAQRRGFIPFETNSIEESGWGASPVLGLGERDDIVWTAQQITVISAEQLGTSDTDGDGTRDYQDPDDDNDGLKDVNDMMPYDTDNDGINNAQDTDDDNDGTPDNVDPAPLDPLITGITETPSSRGGGSLSILFLFMLLCAGRNRYQRTSYM